MVERAVIVAMPVEGSNPENIVAGSIQMVCEACGVKCWVAPSSRVLQTEHDATLMCIPCGLDFVGDTNAEIYIDDRQIEEIEQHQRSKQR